MDSSAKWRRDVYQNEDVEGKYIIKQLGERVIRDNLGHWLTNQQVTFFAFFGNTKAFIKFL